MLVGVDYARRRMVLSAQGLGQKALGHRCIAFSREPRRIEILDQMHSPSSSLPAVINTNAGTERRNMKAKVGLWIDHREAFIVVLTEKGEETKRIKSTVEKQLRRSGRSPSNESFEPQLVPADDTRERDYMGHLANYYDEVIACIGDAETILIFGPGEAKGELKKRMERDKIGIRIVAMETADKMTQPQIVAKVKQRLL